MDNVLEFKEPLEYFGTMAEGALISYYGDGTPGLALMLSDGHAKTISVYIEGQPLIDRVTMDINNLGTEKTNEIVEKLQEEGILGEFMGTLQSGLVSNYPMYQLTEKAMKAYAHAMSDFYDD